MPRALPKQYPSALRGAARLGVGRMKTDLQGSVRQRSWDKTNCRRWRLYQRLCGVILALGLALGPGPGVGAGEPRTVSPEELKAAFLLSFPKYVEWPARAFAGPDSAIVFGIVGDDRLSAELERLGTGKTANGRGLVFRRLTSRDEFSGCHILFVSATQAPSTSEVLGKVAGRSVLTVGESPDFLGRGMIALTQKDRKMTIEINLAEATAAQLVISSKLLGVATVRGRPN